MLGFSWQVQMFSLETTHAQCVPNRYSTCVPHVQYSLVKVKVVKVKVVWKRDAEEKNLTVEKRVAVVTLGKGEYKHAIATKHNISICAVQEILKKAKRTGTVKDRIRTGWPRATTECQDHLVKRLSLSNRRATSKMLKRELEDATGTQVCSSTIRRCLQESGLKVCVAARQPLCTQAHKQKRLEWCREQKDWTSKQWAKMFSDKLTFELIPGMKKFVRGRVGEWYYPDFILYTAKHRGGKIQVWGCMATSGVGSLKVVNSQLDAAAYVRLICCIVEKDGRKLCGRDFISQRSGAPCHRANRTKSWF